MNARQPKSTRDALSQVMKIVGAVSGVLWVAMLVAPLGPHSQLMVLFTVGTWFCLAALAGLGVTFLVMGRKKP